MLLKYTHANTNYNFEYSGIYIPIIVIMHSTQYPQYPQFYTKYSSFDNGDSNGGTSTDDLPSPF